MTQNTASTVEEIVARKDGDARQFEAGSRRRDEPVLKVRRLAKTYHGQVEAVKGVDFDVAAGEVFGLLGPNGAGKSTTIGMLTTTIATSRPSVLTPASAMSCWTWR